MRPPLRTALVAVVVAASACSTPVERPEGDATIDDASVPTDAGESDVGDTSEGIACRRFCPPAANCDIEVEQPEEVAFRFPPGLEPSEFGPVMFEDFEGANPDATSTLTNPDPRWPSQYHEGAFVPFGESFRASMGVLSPIAQETAGPYRVFVSAWVDYRPAPVQIAAPMPGRQDNFFDGRASSAVFEVPAFPVIVDFEFPPESLGGRGLHDVVVLIRVSSLNRTHATRFVERFSIFNGGNRRVTDHPCFVTGEPVSLTEQEMRLSRLTHFFYRDEQSISEQRTGFQEDVEATQSAIEITMGSPPSRAPGLSENISEVLFVFRNEELVLQEHIGRHPESSLNASSSLSHRRQIQIELPVDEERFEVWGFAIQHPYQPELDYETGAVDREIQEQVDAPSALGTTTYRIRRVQ